MRDLNDCIYVERVLARQDEGQEPVAAERERANAHLRECAACRALVGAAHWLAFDGSAGPAPALDELARHRALNELVDRVRGAEDVASRRRWWRVALPAAALLVAGFLLLAHRPPRSAPASAPRAGAGTVTAAPAHILMVAGQGGGPPLEASLRAGSVIRAVTGVVAVRLAGGVRALLDEGAELRLAQIDKDRLRVDLWHGCLRASVDPRPAGSSFVVGTRRGEVEVTGTLFAVCARAEGATLQVVHGEVRVRDRLPHTRTLGASMGCRLGVEGSVAVTNEAREATSRAAAVLAALADVDAARLGVESEPSAALVTLDGQPLGETPLVAAVPAGRHRLVVRGASGGEVNENLRLRVGEMARRVFELSPASSAGAPPPERSPEAWADRAPRRASVEPTQAPTPTASELLSAAHSLRSAGRWAATVAAYERFIAAFPDSPDAMAAQISVGDIELQYLGAADKALAAYVAYLDAAPEGPLALEASYGRARALRALGRQAAERDALRELIARYPLAIVTPLARERLEAIEASDR